MYWGLINFSDFSSREALWAHCFVCQKSVILLRFLKASLIMRSMRGVREFVAVGADVDKPVPTTLA
jgi:hypothetical protein